MSSYSLELKLNIEKDPDRNYLEHYFREVAKIGNTVRRFAMRQIQCLRRDPDYRKLLKEYLSFQDDQKKKRIIVR